MPTNSDLDLILIDDDELVRESWAYSADGHGKRILTFSSGAEIPGETPRDLPIYIDYRLDGGRTGLTLAADLHERGFTKLYLATGERPGTVTAPPWLPVVGKFPPWDN